MYGWMDMYMSPQTSSEAEPSRLRRRVIVELTPDEVPLLDAAERRHGGKRAAMVAGLRADAEAAAATAHGKTAAEPPARATDTAKATHANDAQARVPRAQDRSKSSLPSARASAMRPTPRSRASKTAPWPPTRRPKVSTSCFSRTSPPSRTSSPETLFCGRCERWAPEGEWAWRADGTHELAYHSPCGDHGPGVLSDATWLARRRRGQEKSTP